MAAALTRLSDSSGDEDRDNATARGGTSSDPQHQIAIPGGRTPKGSLLISHHPQSPGSLLQIGSQVGLAIHQSKDKVAHFQTISVETRALLYSLLKLDNHLSYNTRLRNING
jgi:hypothetical protein